MSTIVCKFGGSSAAGAEGFREILSILRASPSRRCAVLSAPGIDAGHGEKVTGMLEKCWDNRADSRALRLSISAVVTRYVEIAAGLGLPSPREMFSRAIARAVRIPRDHTLSRGELLCARLFSLYSGIPVVDAAGIICFNADGAVDEAATCAALIALSRRYERVLLPGFYGATPSGGVRTFPRNGSDITGALAAAGFGATLYENWTDVPGLMTGDPEIVPDARLIPQVSYRQMRAIAREGARVLHPACLDPVAMAGIPTRLRQTSCPECYGTLIDDRCSEIAKCVIGSLQAGLPRGKAQPAACVCAFGMNYDWVKQISAPLAPLCVEPTRDGARVYVSPENYETAARLLHAEMFRE